MFTGKGTRNSNNPETEADYINNRINPHQKKGLQRRQAVIDNANKVVPRARVSTDLGGGSTRINEKIRSRFRNKDKNPNATSRCAMCGIHLLKSQQYKTILNTGDLTYCKNCALTREGQNPAKQFRYNASGKIIPSDDPNKRRPKAKRGFK